MTKQNISHAMIIQLDRYRRLRAMAERSRQKQRLGVTLRNHRLRRRGKQSTRFVFRYFHLFRRFSVFCRSICINRCEADSRNEASQRGCENGFQNAVQVKKVTTAADQPMPQPVVSAVREVEISMGEINKPELWENGAGIMLLVLAFRHSFMKTFYLDLFRVLYLTVRSNSQGSSTFCNAHNVANRSEHSLNTISQFHTQPIGLLGWERFDGVTTHCFTKFKKEWDYFHQKFNEKDPNSGKEGAGLVRDFPTDEWGVVQRLFLMILWSGPRMWSMLLLGWRSTARI